MKIYDVSQELLSSATYPGDPVPQLTVLSSMDQGDIYNLTSFSACSHNGTHVDAPRHFIKDGKTVREMDLERLVGYAYVASASGQIDGEDAKEILKKATSHSNEAAKRILIKGDATVTLDAAEAFYLGGVSLIGSETQSVGPIEAPMAVHKLLLKNDVALLEGLRLASVHDGVYFLSAAPINVGIAEGAPCRALLIDFE